MPFLTLLTDFGLQDVYVGVVKGAIAHVNPSLTVIDLTHQIPPQDLMAARFNLLAAVPYFPDRTVHVAIVDPGVGGSRQAIAIQFQRGFLVGPDNGIFSGVLEHYPAIEAVELTRPQYWRTANPSRTFHGRDIFATVGAHLASGALLRDFGEPIALETLVDLPLPACESQDGTLGGCIQYIDHFGNLITNIPAEQLSKASWSVELGFDTIPKKDTYADAPLGSLVSLIGSHGWLEIAVNGGSAQAHLQVTVGHPLQVRLQSVN